MMNLALLQNFDPGRIFFKSVPALEGFSWFFQILNLEKNMNKDSLFVDPPLQWGLDDGFVSWKVEFWWFEGWYIMDVDVLHGQNPQFGMVSSFVSLREPQIFVFSTKDMPLLGTQFGSESISDVTRYQIPGRNASISGLGSAACYCHPGVT